MPNHCFNKIIIEVGDSDTVSFESVVDSLHDDDEQNTVFDFNAIIPMPSELKNTTKGYGAEPPDETKNARLRKKYGADNWYDWSITNWGTKWNSYDSEIVDHEIGERIEYTFDTAWGPPMAVIEALREQCPDFNISAFYDEPMMEAAGYY